MFYLEQYFFVFALIGSLNGSYIQFVLYNTSNYLEVNDTPVNLLDNDIYQLLNQDDPIDTHKVEVKLFYETLCGDCIKFDKEQFSPAVQKLNQYVDFFTYPYGNAETVNDKGVIEFYCQHGPRECYGNKLHACSIDNLKNNTEAFVFNSCMMGGMDRGSNDAAADRCGKSLGVDSTPIKACAKGDRGTSLLEYYGEQSKKADFSYVPYILINGKETDGSTFLKDICAAFAVTPPPCVDLFID